MNVTFDLKQTTPEWNLETVSSHGVVTVTFEVELRSPAVSNFVAVFNKTANIHNESLMSHTKSKQDTFH